MNFTNKIKYISIGLIIGIILSTTVGIVFAANVSSIKVNFNPLKYYFFGTEKTPPSDQKGFIYGGRTFVSARFISEALNIPISWDGATNTIFVGNKDSAQGTGQSSYLEDVKATSSISSKWSKVENFESITGEKYNHGYAFSLNDNWNSPNGGSSVVNKYLLSGKYTRFQAIISPNAMWKTKKEINSIGTFKCYSDNKLVFESGDISSSLKDPILIDLNLIGVMNFEIDGSGNDLGLIDAKFLY